MEISIQPQATVCWVSQQPFVEGRRVVSVLLRGRQNPDEIMRRDMLESEAGNFVADGPLMCRWVREYKPRKANENPERELKLTAENLFMTLVDPATELTPETERLVKFLALMLERKRVLRPKGRSADGSKNLYEHAKTKQMIEVPGGELTPEFFVQVQEQLSVLVGGGEPKETEPDAEVKTEAVAETEAAPASPQEPAPQVALSQDVPEPQQEPAQDSQEQQDDEKPVTQEG
ncbi:hypothetical protein M2103_001681 [Ereboglobus sp. PH5-5]|uniref:hypothetical protein n=1 Tax=Ereboglobus sp. PH5-5 TaxID=2940529 RepID=UPI002404EEDF|nr:hypothetical protein [Ereboglobus sp. PH5-5]MDF9833457.1 hypothetical protein [Ereboglobus sp. PH5-5]